MLRTIELEDHGQDFLEWDIDENGVIVETRPFQGWVWNGDTLRNLRTGRHPAISHKGAEFKRLNYPIKSVRRKAA